MTFPLVNLPDAALKARLVHGFLEDFFEYVDADLWTLITAVDGSALLADGNIGGAIQIRSATVTADNEDAYLELKTEAFKFAADKPLMLEARVKHSPAATNQANLVIGLMDAVAADAMQDDGAGPKASYSGVVFFTVDGDNTWQVENSITTTQKTTTLDTSGSLDGQEHAYGNGVYEILRIEWTPINSTKGDFRFYIDETLVAVHTNQTYTSATDMHVVIGVKDGGAGDEETLVVDYIQCWQKR